jgi:hypothetical protein
VAKLITVSPSFAALLLCILGLGALTLATVVSDGQRLGDAGIALIGAGTSTMFRGGGPPPKDALK